MGLSVAPYMPGEIMLTTRVRVILSAGFLGAVMYVRGHAAGGSEEQDASAVQSAQAEWREEKDSNRVRDRPVIVPRELDELRLEVSVAAGPGYSRPRDRKSTRLNSSHYSRSRMPSSA